MHQYIVVKVFSNRGNLQNLLTRDHSYSSPWLDMFELLLRMLFLSPTQYPTHRGVVWLSHFSPQYLFPSAFPTLKAKANTKFPFFLRYPYAIILANEILVEIFYQLG